MLPDGPGFAEAFAGIIEHQALPLPVNPLLAAPDITAAATKTGAGVLARGCPEFRGTSAAAR
jgi:hypothetical protein